MYAIETAGQVECKEKAALIPQTSTRSISYGTKDASETLSQRLNRSGLDQLLEEESRVPWSKILNLSALFFTVVVLNLLKGSGDNLEWLPFEVTCGSTAFHTLEVANVVIIVLFAIYVRHTLIQETLEKQALSYQFVEGDVVWDDTNTWKYSCICSVAGLFAGLFGIGKGCRVALSHSSFWFINLTWISV